MDLLSNHGALLYGLKEVLYCKKTRKGEERTWQLSHNFIQTWFVLVTGVAHTTALISMKIYLLSKLIERPMVHTHAFARVMIVFCTSSQSPF